MEARDGLALLAGFAGALRRSELAALTIGDLTWHPADGIHVRIRASKTDQDAAGATIVLPYGRHPQTCPPCAALRWLRLLDAAAHGRPALMRAVLQTPPWSEQDHLYPHPDDSHPDDSHPDDSDPDDSARGSDAPVGPRAVGPGATAQSPACRAPVPDLPAGMPLLRAVRKGGTLADAAVTGDALHAMIGRRATAAGLVGPIGFHSLRAGFVTAARRAGADHRAVRRQTRHSSDAMVEAYDRDHTPLAGNAVTTRSSVPALETLTARELEVLTHVAEGRSNRGIAKILGIEERTVENHVGNVFRKLELPEGNQRVLAVLELQKGGG